MELLKQRIREVGQVLSNEVIKLDAILNHAVDPVLTTAMGKEFATIFAEEGVTKILTIESSGIPIAFAAAQILNVPMVFARRKNRSAQTRPKFTVSVFRLLPKALLPILW